MFNKVLLKTNIAVWFHIQTFFQNNKSTVKCLKRRYLQFGRTLTEICVQFDQITKSKALQPLLAARICKFATFTD